METNYSFSVRVEQTELSIGGDKEFVQTYMDKWLNLFKDKLPAGITGDNTDSGQESQTQSQPVVKSMKKSLPDFIKLKAPKNYNDLILTVFFYYERYEGMENTGVRFKRVSDFINQLPNHPSTEEIETVKEQLVNDGFILLMPGTEEDPCYQVSFTGEQCVKQGFTTEEASD